MNRNDHNTKIYNLLNNPSTYSKSKKDPTTEINNTLTITLNKLKDKNIIAEKLYTCLHCSTNIAPKFYGLPKIHKIDCPLRPITSFIGSPLYNLSELLSKSMQKTVGHIEYHIKDSFEFKSKISNTYIPNNFTIISLDAVSMYTNISWNLIRKSVKLRWNQIKTNTFLKQTDFGNILQFCLESSYCTLNNEFYNQIFGLPIGSPSSATAANFAMKELEKNFF